MRLLSIEYFKLKNSRYFWILLGLFMVMLLFIPFVTEYFVNMISEAGNAIEGMEGLSLPFFDFVDIWQNMYFIFKFFSVFLGFIIVISVSNDISQGMMKQNVIDGLSRSEYLISKVWMIIVLSGLASLVTVVIILFLGFRFSPVIEWTYISKHLEFIPAYFLHLIAFQLFCLLVTLLIKRSGFSIAFLLFYVFMIEPIIAVVMMNHGLLFWSEFLPVNAINNIIRFPFPRYVLQETQTSIAAFDLTVLIAYIGVLGWGSYSLMTRRDLS
jgi:ABC-type transport system involved in multi-copper enzyme maturation permease subunit